jgi:hypothetical protein
LQLVAAKISKPKFLENGGNSLNFSKVFNRECGGSILEGQPGILVFGEFSFLDEKGPPNAGFSRRR